MFRSQENSAFFSEQHVDIFPGELTAIVPSSQHAVLVSSLPTLHWPLKTQNLVLLQESEARVVCPACFSPPLGLQAVSLCTAQNAWLQGSCTCKPPAGSRIYGSPLEQQLPSALTSYVLVPFAPGIGVPAGFLEAFIQGFVISGSTWAFAESIEKWFLNSDCIKESSILGV